MSLYASRTFAPARNGAASHSLGRPAAVFPGGIVTDARLKIAVDRLQTTLAAPVAIGDLQMTVANPAGIVVNTLLSIEDEIVNVLSIAGPVIGIGRGFDGTSPAAHGLGALVSGFVDAWYHNAMASEVIAIEQLLGTTGAPGGAISAAQYVWSQSPGGNLVAGANVIQLAAPYPALVVGDYLRISGGTGTAETPQISGWNPATGQVIVNCANTHSGAWTIGTATAGAQEAFNTAVNLATAAGSSVIPPVVLSGNPIWWEGFNFHGYSNATVLGNGAVIDFRGGRNGGWVFANFGSSGSGTTVSANVNNGGGTILTDTTRAFLWTNTVNVTSAAGMTVGGYLWLQYSDSYKAGGGSQQFSQVVRIANIAGTVITTLEPVVIPLNTANTNSVTPITFVANIAIRDLTIDGFNMTSPAVQIINMTYWRGSLLQNLRIQNFDMPGSGSGIQPYVGINNTFDNLIFDGVNTHGAGADFGPYHQTAMQVSNLRSLKGSFGPSFINCTFANVSNVDVEFSTGRGFKMVGLVWSKLANINIAQDAATGFSVQGGSYQNDVCNLSAIASTGTLGWGLHFSGQGNVYNRITNCSFMGNNGQSGGGLSSDVVFGSVGGYLDTHNYVTGLQMNANDPANSFAYDQAGGNYVQCADWSVSASATAGVATVNSANCQITTEALTTAAGGVYQLTLNNNRISGPAGKTQVNVTLSTLGTCNTGLPFVQGATCSTSGGSANIVIRNLHASQAFNGTLVMNIQIVSTS